MDVEARRKFCGLLMFDVPTVSTKSSTRNSDIIINNMSTRDDLPYESSHNMIDHQFVIQDGLSDFSTSNHALAAGAAAGGDYMSQEGLDSNVVDGDSKTHKRTPRPPNAFILYRRAKQPGIIASQRNLTNAEVSRTISDMWRKEPEETRLEWERYADRKKLEHMQTYPNYVYRPNKNKSKVDKRRQQRKQTPKEPTNSSNNSPIENKSTPLTGPVRRRSTKNNNKPPTKLDLPMNNGMAGFNMQQSMNQQQSSTNSNSRTNTVTSTSPYTTILPSPEIPLLTAHYTDNPEEFQSQLTPITPVTPLTPPEHDFKIQNNLLRLVPVEDLTYPQHHHHHHHHQQGNPQFSFQSIPGLTSYNQTVDPLDFCFVPDVAQQQQQMIAEIMLHHDQNHHITPTATVPSSNPAQYYSNGTNTAAHSFTEMLGFEFPNFLGGSVNHHDNNNGLDAPDHQYLH